MSGGNKHFFSPPPPASTPARLELWFHAPPSPFFLYCALARYPHEILIFLDFPSSCSVARRFFGHCEETLKINYLLMHKQISVRLKERQFHAEVCRKVIKNLKRSKNSKLIFNENCFSDRWWWRESRVEEGKKLISVTGEARQARRLLCWAQTLDRSIRDYKHITVDGTRWMAAELIIRLQTRVLQPLSFHPATGRCNQLLISQ